MMGRFRRNGPAARGARRALRAKLGAGLAALAGLAIAVLLLGGDTDEPPAAPAALNAVAARNEEAAVAAAARLKAESTARSEAADARLRNSAGGDRPP